MATLADFRTRVSAKIGLDNTAAGQEQLLMDSWANEAVRDILLRTRVHVDQDTTALTPGVGDYRFPASILKIVECFVTSQNQTFPLRLTTPQDILRARMGSVQGSPVTRLAMQGSDYLMVYPTPTQANVLTLYLILKPAELTSGAHDPANLTYGGIPTEFHKAIEWYMLSEASDYDETDGNKKMMAYRQLYEQELGKIRHSVNGKLGRLPGIPIPGTRGARYWGLQPSQIGV